MTQPDNKLFQQLVQAGMDTDRPSEDLRRRVLAAALSAQQEAAELGDSAAIAQDSTQPAVRLVPDVPTVQADGVQRGPHPIEQPPRRRHTRWRFVTMFQKRSVRWSMAAAIAAAVVLVVGLWPDGAGRESGNGIVWADVVRQIQSARTANLRYVLRDPTINDGQEVTQNVYIKSPRRVRLEDKDPKTLNKRVLIDNGYKAIVLHPDKKQFRLAVPSTWTSSIEDYLAMFSAAITRPCEEGAESQTVQIGRDQYRLVSCGPQVRDGRKFNKYLLESADTPAQAREKGGEQDYFWFDPKDNRVVLVTQERIIHGTPQEVMQVNVLLNVELADDLFSTEAPAGYTEDPTSIAVRKLEDLLAQYEQAREHITYYRLIAWETRIEKSTSRPTIRCARDGAKWRVDEVQQINMKENADFDNVWEQLRPASFGVSIFHDHEREARILWDNDAIADRRDHDDPNLTKYLLAELGWPKWPMRPGDTILDEKASYRRLPDRPDRPGLIGIEYRRLGQSGKSPFPGRLEIFWLDPTKNYLCIYHAVHLRYGSPWQDKPDWQPSEPVTNNGLVDHTCEIDQVREITEFSQTPAGQWYPTTVRRSDALVFQGKRFCDGPNVTRIQVDFTGPIPAELFEQPDDAPPAK